MLYIVKSEWLSFTSALYTCLIFWVQVTLVWQQSLIFPSIFDVYKDGLGWHCRKFFAGLWSAKNIIVFNSENSTRVSRKTLNTPTKTIKKQGYYIVQNVMKCSLNLMVHCRQLYWSYNLRVSASQTNESRTTYVSQIETINVFRKGIQVYNALLHYSANSIYNI